MILDLCSFYRFRIINVCKVFFDLEINLRWKFSFLFIFNWSFWKHNFSVNQKEKKIKAKYFMGCYQKENLIADYFFLTDMYLWYMMIYYLISSVSLAVNHFQTFLPNSLISIWYSFKISLVMRKCISPIFLKQKRQHPLHLLSFSFSLSPANFPSHFSLSPTRFISNGVIIDGKVKSVSI